MSFSILDQSNQFDRRISGVWGYSQFLQHPYYVIWCSSTAAWHHFIFAIVLMLNCPRGPFSAQCLLAPVPTLQNCNNSLAINHSWKTDSTPGKLVWISASIHYYVLETLVASFWILQLPDEFSFCIQIPQNRCSLLCV